MAKVSNDWIRRMREWLAGDLFAAPPEDAGRVQMTEAYDELLAFREGYDPAERLPEAGRRVWVRLADGRRHAGCLSIVEPGTISFGRAEEPAQVVDMVRWYPLPGGER